MQGENGIIVAQSLAARRFSRARRMPPCLPGACLAAGVRGFLRRGHRNGRIHRRGGAWRRGRPRKGILPQPGRLCASFPALFLAASRRWSPQFSGTGDATGPPALFGRGAGMSEKNRGTCLEIFAHGVVAPRAGRPRPQWGFFQWLEKRGRKGDGWGIAGGEGVW